MKTVKEWLKAKNNEQFVPKIIVGRTFFDEVTRICDDKSFALREIVHIKQIKDKNFLIYSFEPDNIHVKVAEMGTAPRTAKVKKIPINEIK